MYMCFKVAPSTVALCKHAADCFGVSRICDLLSVSEQPTGKCRVPPFAHGSWNSL